MTLLSLCKSQDAKAIPDSEIDCTSVLLPGITVSPDQLATVSAILRSRTSEFGGLIVPVQSGQNDASDPGSKTLPVLIAMAITSTQRGYLGPSIVLAPAPSCLQWVQDAKRFLKPVSVP